MTYRKIEKRVRASQLKKAKALGRSWVEEIVVTRPYSTGSACTDPFTGKAYVTYHQRDGDGAVSGKAAMKKKPIHKPVNVKIAKGSNPDINFVVEVRSGGKTLVVHGLDLVRATAAAALAKSRELHSAVVRATGG